MFVAWGRELGFLYNDSYAETLGAKHPAALCRRFHDIWSETPADRTLAHVAAGFRHALEVGSKDPTPRTRTRQHDQPNATPILQTALDEVSASRAPRDRVPPG